MFDVAPQELIVLGTVALLVIPPKDLPRAMRTAGYWIGRARGVARQFRSGFDSMVRDAELAEMEKRWKEENERIMREHPPTRLDQPAVEAPETDEPGPPVMTEQPTIASTPPVPEPAEVPAPEPAEGRHAVPTVVPAGPAALPAADGTASS